MELFQQWRNKHIKSYDYEKEELKRFDNFKSNLKYVVQKTGIGPDLRSIWTGSEKCIWLRLGVIVILLGTLQEGGEL